MDANGNEQVIYEIVARKLEIINQEDRRNGLTGEAAPMEKGPQPFFFSAN
jgi:hypothetical protein